MAYPERNWPAIMQELKESGLTIKDFSIRILPPIETAPPLRQNRLGGERWKMSKILSVGRQSAKEL